MGGKLENIIQDPEFFETLCVHISSGGSLIDVAEMNNVPYGRLCAWVNQDPERRKRYTAACEDQERFLKASILRELQRITLVDIRQAFNEDGSLKNLEDMPPELGAQIKEIKVDELFEGRGQERQHVGYTKHIKFWDKLKAIELIGKELKMFVNQHEVSGNLSDILDRSWRENNGRSSSD